MKPIVARILSVIAAVGAMSMSTTVRAETIETRIGTLSFTHDLANGYPTKETVQKLYDERDFQRACQLYLWALPIVASAQGQEQARTLFAAGQLDLFLQRAIAS